MVELTLFLFPWVVAGITYEIVPEPRHMFLRIPWWIGLSCWAIIGICWDVALVFGLVGPS